MFWHILSVYLQKEMEIYKIQNRTINLRGYETAAVIMLIALLGLVNFFYLRRGRLENIGA